MATQVVYAFQLYKNGNRLIKVSAMFQLIYVRTVFTQHLVLDGRTSIKVIL